MIEYKIMIIQNYDKYKIMIYIIDDFELFGLSK